MDSIAVATFVLAVAVAGCRAERDATCADGGAQAETRASSPRGRRGDIPPGRVLEVVASTRIAAGAYLRPPIAIAGDTEQRSAVILIRNQRGLTLDLSGVELAGVPPGTDLDRARGFGILIEHSDDVTVRGGRIEGFKGGIVAHDCRNLVIDGVTFDRGYASRLLSTASAEDASDWLYPHENDAGEWLANYGGAISLTDCAVPRVSGCRGRHGQNGILLTRCDGAAVYDNDFSFLSGWGLALYRSSKNVVSHNLFEYCVRGYSHDVYWRGQDSAGILMFERCSDNLFVENSATHSGDGLFLFGGNDIVLGRAAARGELGVGGCDRNVWYRNDFSYAVANAIEATFSSDNMAIENELSFSHQHGVWGGYSSRMAIVGNEIAGTLGGGISIEHGQECVIARNRITDDDIGVELWWDDDPDLVGGSFGKAHDTASRGHAIVDNQFADNARDLVLRKSSGLSFARNTFGASNGQMQIDDLRVVGLTLTAGHAPRDFLAGDDGSRPSGAVTDVEIAPLADETSAMLRKALAFECPPVRGTQVTSASSRGLRQGLDTIVMGEWGPWDFRGGEPRPKPRASGGLLAGAQWDATWFAWHDATDPRSDLDAWRALQFQPLARATIEGLASPWSSAEIQRRVGHDHFGLVASTELEIAAAGRYRISVVSDDGVRVKIDGEAVLENWTWHGPTRDDAEVELAVGRHRIDVEYFQIDGAAALSIELANAAGP